MIKLKSLLKEGKSGSIWDMKTQMKKGTFNPEDPEVLIRGWGRLTLKILQRNIVNELKDLIKRGTGELGFKNMLFILKDNGILMDKIQAVVDVYDELKSSTVKRAITNYKKRRK